MEKSNRLSLAELKAKANTIETNEVLEKIQGGSMDWCHVFWGQAAKIALEIFKDDSNTGPGKSTVIQN